MPRSTLQSWHARQQRLPAQAALVRFLEPAPGLAWLKRLVLAAHLVFHQAGPAGPRPLLAVLGHAGLAPLLACSYGTHQALAEQREELVRRYGAQGRQRLAPAMPARSITLCAGENFHQEQPCLVAPHR